MEQVQSTTLPVQVVTALMGIRDRYLANYPDNSMVTHYCQYGRRGLGYFDWAKAIRRVSSVADAIADAKEVLDLGTGFGYLPWLLKQRGVTCVAADIDAGCPSGEMKNNPEALQLFREVRGALGIEVVPMDPILPMTPVNVPDASARKFDAVTCLHTVFDLLWSERELHYFLTDLAAHCLKPGGEILMMSNHHPEWTGVMTTKLLARTSIARYARSS
jgi:SAM-dependent methyltransferase